MRACVARRSSSAAPCKDKVEICIDAEPFVCIFRCDFDPILGLHVICQSSLKLFAKLLHMPLVDAEQAFIRKWENPPCFHKVGFWFSEYKNDPFWGLPVSISCPYFSVLIQILNSRDLNKYTLSYRARGPHCLASTSKATHSKFQRLQVYRSRKQKS